VAPLGRSGGLIFTAPAIGAQSSGRTRAWSPACRP